MMLCRLHPVGYLMMTYRNNDPTFQFVGAGFSTFCRTSMWTKLHAVSLVCLYIMCSVRFSAGVWRKCPLHAAGAAEGLTPLAVADVKHHAVKNVRLTQRGTLANPDYGSTFIY